MHGSTEAQKEIFKKTDSAFPWFRATYVYRSYDSRLPAAESLIK